MIRVLLVLALIAPACGSGEEPIDITETREMPGGRTLAKPDATTAERLGFRVRNPGPARTGTPQLTWAVPKGWEQLDRDSLRAGNFRVTASPDIECSVSILKGNGGGLLANLNRWRNQMGLAPYPPEEARSLKQVPILGRVGVYSNFVGSYKGMGTEEKKDFRLLGVTLLLPDQAVFVKMTGPEAAVAAEETRFLALCRSMKMKSASAGMPAGHGGGSSSAGGFSWTAPGSWKQGPKKSMRLVTFHPDGNTKAQCYIALLGGAAGGVVDNINRWRQQLGRPDLSATQIEKLPKVKVLGKPCTMVEVAGKFQDMDAQGPEKGGFALLGVVTPLEGRTLFIKFTGPAKVVSAEKKNFIAFCESIR